MALRPPARLSPSSMSSFTNCPLAFRFSYMERLPEAPSPAACKGTLVHLALQHLMWRRPEDRTLEAALTDLEQARAELAEDAEFLELELTEEEWATFHADAEALVRRYFTLEDPTTVRPVGLELAVEAELDDGLWLRGIIDRLELDEDGELVVTDYKTGVAPRSGWEQQRMNGVHVYALLCERILGRRPARVQLLYLGDGGRISAEANDQSVRGAVNRASGVRQAIARACQQDDFRPRRSKLCDWCSFREFCPEFGGDPAQAAPVLHARRAARAGRPQLPLVTAGPPATTD